MLRLTVKVGYYQTKSLLVHIDATDAEAAVPALT